LALGGKQWAILQVEVRCDSVYTESDQTYLILELKVSFSLNGPFRKCVKSGKDYKIGIGISFIL